MANEINQSGIGNAAFQNISGSTINYSQQIVGRSPEYAEMLDQQKQLEDYLQLIPESDAEKRSDIASKLFKLREKIDSFKADVLKLAESFSRIEINTDRLRRAKEHFDKGEITEARVVLEDALEEMVSEKTYLLGEKKKYEEDTAPKLQSKADEYLILAQTTALNYESPSRISDARQYFEDSIECAKVYENLFAYALFLWEHSEFSQAIDFWQWTLEIAQESSDRNGEENSLGNLGNAYLFIGEYQKAIYFYEQALAISQINGDRSGEAKSLGNLGSVYCSLGEYQKAIDFQERSLEIKREISDRRGEGNSFINLGLAYYYLGKCQKAIEFYERGLKISREFGIRRAEGASLGNLGLAYDSLGEYKKAIEFHEQYLKISREIGDRLGEGNSLGNLGLAYYSLGDYKRATEFHEQSLEIKRETGNQRGEANSLGNIGLAYIALGEYHKAIEFHKQALNTALRIGDKFNEGNQLGNLGLAHSKMGSMKEACRYWQQALFIYETIGVPQADLVRKLMQDEGCLEGKYKTK